MDERVQWKCSGGHIVHKSREICSICGDSQSRVLDNALGDDSAAHNARGNQADTSNLVADLDRSGQQHGRATAVGKWIAASVVAVVVGLVVVAAFAQHDSNAVEARAEAEDFWNGLTPAFRGQLCADIRFASEGFIRERFRNDYMDEQREEHGFGNTRDDLWDYAQKFGAAMAEIVLEGCTTTDIRWPLIYCDNSMARPQFPWQGALMEEYEDGTVKTVGGCSVTFDEDGNPDGYRVP